MIVKVSYGSYYLVIIGPGAKYEVPIFCINDPLEYRIEKKKHITKEDFSAEAQLVGFIGGEQWLMIVD